MGAVIVNPLGQIIASGYNGSPRGFPHCNDVGCHLDTDGHCLRSIHAEMNALIQCAQSGTSTLGARMFVTHSSCHGCAKHVIQAGIISVIYAWEYKDLQEVQMTMNLAGVNFHKFMSLEAV